MNYWYTQGGEEFHVDAHGSISRPRIGTGAFGQWKVVGAVRYNNSGHPVEFVPFPQCFTEPRDWRYKNGKAKWHIKDCDHGTLRVQGAPVTGAGVLS